MTDPVQVLRRIHRPDGRHRRPAPAVANEERVAGPGARRAAGFRLLRVLIVDDCRDTTDTTAELLGCWGHDARRAYNGATALAAAVADPPDLLLVDLAMRGIDGCELARQVRRRPALQRALLVAVTAYVDAGHRQLAEQAGFDHFFSKPIDLPQLEALLASHEQRLQRTPGPGNLPPGDHQILVVDDDDGVRGLLAAGLPREGFAVRLAANGQEAADLYRKSRPAIDVVLMDVRMPGRDGPETLAALREQDPQVRCCFMSGDLGEHTENGLRELGTGEVLRKPFTMAEAGRVLRREVGRRETEEADRDDHWRDDGGQGQRPAS